MAERLAAAASTRIHDWLATGGIPRGKTMEKKYDLIRGWFSGPGRPNGLQSRGGGGAGDRKLFGPKRGGHFVRKAGKEVHRAERP